MLTRIYYSIRYGLYPLLLKFELIPTIDYSGDAKSPFFPRSFLSNTLIIIHYTLRFAQLS